MRSSLMRVITLSNTEKVPLRDHRLQSSEQRGAEQSRADRLIIVVLLSAPHSILDILEK
jgi:hypothetical protein